MNALPVLDLVDRAAKLFDIPASVIVEPHPSRKPAAVRARAAVIMAAHTAGWSYHTIGDVLGKRDHTTICHADNNTAAALYRDDEQFRQHVDAMNQAVRFHALTVNRSRSIQTANWWARRALEKATVEERAEMRRLLATPEFSAVE